MADFKLTKLLQKKREGQKLTADEIQHFINCAVKSTIPDIGKCPNMSRAQIGAMLMAIYLKGLDQDETSELTMQMKDSGYVFTWPEKWKHLVVDKHSTGGVGDKVSLILAPALAAVGLKVPMISGRSLSHTGGTLDKLECIPGFKTSLSKEEIYKIIDSTGCCIVGQTEEFVPADKVLYQCREITATVTYSPLIIASIVSKKLCEGLSTLVYDVKYGKGSVFDSQEEAAETAKNLVKFSKGVKSSALLTSMEQPLGKTIGNTLEVIEALGCLKGNVKDPFDVIYLTCALGGELVNSVKNTVGDEGAKIVLETLKNGKALEKFESMMINQGVAPRTARELCYGNAAAILPKAEHETDINYTGQDGFITEIDPLVLANVWKDEWLHSEKHPGVGLTLLKVVDDKIKAGDPWIRVHHQCTKISDEVVCLIKNAIKVEQCKSGKVLVNRKFILSDKSNVIEDHYFSV